ncbi:MAG: hypothetical protein FJY07_13390, partial [Bacteroidetes bacterium]|nr:hypothetical protein [Bacteroidota bacterium]
MKNLLRILSAILLLVLKLYSQSYDFEWASRAGGESSDIGFSVTSSVNNNFFVTGWFLDTAYFGNYSLASFGSFDIYITKMDGNGEFIWAKQAGGTSIDQGSSLTSDSVGNIFVTGFFNGTATFDNHTLTSAGQSDIFVAKMTQFGNYYWVKRAGGSGSDAGNKITTDLLGNTYVTGYFNDSASFGNHTVYSTGQCDYFLTKLDYFGNFIWVRTGGGLQVVTSKSLTTDDEGNIYIIGQFAGGMDAGDTTIYSFGSSDIFIAKYDTYGNFIWIRQAGGISGDIGQSCTTDIDGNVYLTGMYNGEAAFGNFWLSNLVGTNIFLCKMNETGEFEWATQPVNKSYSWVNSLTASENRLFLTGYFYDSIYFGNTLLICVEDHDLFVASSDFEGDFQWAAQAEGDSTNSGVEVTFNSNENIIVTGLFNKSCSFGDITLESSGHQDIFVTKMSKITEISYYIKDHNFISPNPATTFITLTAPGDLPIEQAIVYNHLGQKVLTAK